MRAQRIEFPESEFGEKTGPSRLINFTLFSEERIVVMEEGGGSPYARSLEPNEKYKVLSWIEVPDGLLPAAKYWIQMETNFRVAQATLGYEMWRTFRRNGTPKETSA